MQTEQIKILDEQALQIANMLQTQGLTPYEINKILNGEYTTFQTNMDLSDIFSSDGNHQNVLRGLADGYSIEELQQHGVSLREIEEFIQTLDKYNLTIENAKAINQYSNGSNMILSIKRGTADKSEIQNGIRTDIIGKLQNRGLSQKQILSLENYIERLDFSKPVYENYEIINQYMQKMNVPRNCYPSICTAVKNLDSLKHIDSTLASLDDGLSKSRLPQSMKLYRAIRKNGDVSLESYVGKSISNNGYTSTSPLYDSSFAKYDDYDTVIEIYAPKGTQGCYITQLSDYDSTEKEILLNSNDIYIVDAQKGIIDKNGRTKTVLKGLLLSKEIECYKGIEKQQETKTNSGQQQYKDTIKKENEEVSLPAKQNRFSSFFNQIRAKFARRNRNNTQIDNTLTDNLQLNEYRERQNQTKQKEKKSWKLELEEKVKIQIETAEIPKKYKYQEDQQKQVPTQTLKQEKYQNGQNIIQPTQQQVSPQQPPIDMGGMEL